MGIRLIYIMKPFRLFAMSQEQKQKPLNPEQLRQLAELQSQQNAYTLQISSGLTNTATKHIMAMTDRHTRVNKAKNKGQDNAKHNLCLNVKTAKVTIPTPSGSFNIEVNVWVTSKTSTGLNHKSQARELYDWLNIKETGLTFEQFFAGIEERFAQAQKE